MTLAKETIISQIEAKTIKNSSLPMTAHRVFLENISRM
jgi:hypothetical protein